MVRCVLRDEEKKRSFTPSVVKLIDFGMGADFTHLLKPGQTLFTKASEYATLAKGQGYEPVQKLKVEPMTLKALVRERLESGQEMPSDLFNVFAGNRTKVTRSK